MLLTNGTLSDPPPLEQRPLKASLHGMALDQNARTASSHLKKGIAIWLYLPPSPALVRRLENKPIHGQVLLYDAKIRRVNEKNALNASAILLTIF